MNSRNFYLSKIKAMHRDTKGSKSTEYYTRPFIDLRPDFVLRVQKALFLLLCDFFDSNLSEPDSGGRSKSDYEQTSASPFDAAMASIFCGCGGEQAVEGDDVPGGVNRRPSFSLGTKRRPSFTGKNSKKIHRSEVHAYWVMPFYRPRTSRRSTLTRSPPPLPR